VHGEDVGIWKRVVSPTSVRLTVTADAPMGGDDEQHIATAATSFADFVERPLDLVFA